MRILKVVHGFLPECNGGTERHVLRLSKELVAQGHEVHILCGSQQGAGPVAADANLVHGSFEGLPVHRLHRPGLFLDNWEKSLAPEVEPLFDWLLRDIRPDLIHVHHWIRLTRNLVELAHDRGVPAVATLHDLWTTCPKAFRIREGSFCNLEMGPANCLGCAPAGENMSNEEQRRELALFRDDVRNELDLARRIIVPSVAHREVLLQHMPQLAGRSRVLPHGNISEVRRRKPTRSSFPSGPLRIGHWGHLSHLKGFDILLSAVRDSRHRSDIELHVFGEIVYPQERARFEELADGLAITWHGPYTPADLAKVPLDLAVITSRCSESWSFVLDEAFQLGLPAVVPDRGALKERIGGAGTTFLAESGPDLCAALGEIFKQPKLLELWRSRIPELPGLHDHARRMLSLYREVLSSEAPLPVTRQALRSRRLLQRAWQLETRNRRLEVEQGDGRNLKDDLSRAGKTMDEMQFFHVEKDKELQRLSREVNELRETGMRERNETVREAADELGRRVHELEKKERKKQRRVERLREVADGSAAEAARLAADLAVAEDNAEELTLSLAAAEERAERTETDADVLRTALNAQEAAVLSLHVEASRTLAMLQNAEHERSKALEALSLTTTESIEREDLALAESDASLPLPPLLARLKELIGSLGKHERAESAELRENNTVLLARAEDLERRCRDAAAKLEAEAELSAALKSDVVQAQAALKHAQSAESELRASRQAHSDLSRQREADLLRLEALRNELAAREGRFTEQSAALVCVRAARDADADEKQRLEDRFTEQSAALVCVRAARDADADEKQRLEDLCATASADNAKLREHIEFISAAQCEVLTHTERELGQTRGELKQTGEQAAELKHILEQERGRLRVLESDALVLSDRVRGLGLRLIEHLPDAAVPVDQTPEQALEALMKHLLQRQANAQALLGERDILVSRFATALDSLMTMMDADMRRRRSAITTLPRARAKRLKILMVVHQFLPRHVAGTELYTAALARELSHRHEVVLLSAESDHSRPRFERSVTEVQGLKVHQFIHNYTWKGFRDTYDCAEADDIFRDVLRTERPDIVHVQHLHYHSANYVTIARTQGLPVVYTLHDYMLMCPRDGQLRRADGEICRQPVPSKCRDCIAHHSLEERSTPLIPRALHPGSDALVPTDLALIVRRTRMNLHSDDHYELAAAERLDYLKRVLSDVSLALSPSRFLRDSIVESGLIPADRIVVSDNGFNLAAWKNVQRIPGDGLRISYIGTIAEHKGVHTLIEAMNAVPDAGISCRIFGDLSAFVEYSERLGSMNTNPRTLLMGPLPPERVRDVLAQTDLLVIPSLWPENSPLTVHEAALAAVPVLASNLGGLAEYVLDGITGLLFTAGDANALRAQIHEFAAHGLPGFNPQALEVKSISVDAAEMEQRYRELLAREAANRIHD